MQQAATGFIGQDGGPNRGFTIRRAADQPYGGMGEQLSDALRTLRRYEGACSQPGCRRCSASGGAPHRPASRAGHPSPRQTPEELLNLVQPNSSVTVRLMQGRNWFSRAPRNQKCF